MSTCQLMRSMAISIMCRQTTPVVSCDVGAPGNSSSGNCCAAGCRRTRRLFLRRRVFERFGLYDTSRRIAANYEAILRYLGKGNIRSAYIPEVIVKMCTGGVSEILVAAITTLQGLELLRQCGCKGPQLATIRIAGLNPPRRQSTTKNCMSDARRELPVAVPCTNHSQRSFETNFR